LLNTLMSSIKEVINVTFARKTNRRKFTPKSAATHPAPSKSVSPYVSIRNGWLLITEVANVVLRGYLRITFAPCQIRNSL
jgi:hypothetical protein